MSHKKILILGRHGQTTNIIFNHLDKHFGVTLALIEGKEDPVLYLKRRIRKLGIITVIGQILFRVIIARVQSKFSQKRLEEIRLLNQMDSSPIPSDKQIAVSSVNSEASLAQIARIKPDLIIVNGTRILSKKLIASCGCKIMNVHAGITPQYRGVHGMYWALVNNDIDNCGVTVHFVDAGVDTGDIILQGRVKPERNDNFSTYNYLQLAVGLPLLNKAIESLFNNNLSTFQGTGDSRQWYHPTAWGYCYYRLLRGIK